MAKELSKPIVIYLSVAGAFAAIISGRINTAHLTEGEALIGGWPYWLIGAIFICVSWWLVISDD